MTSHSKCPIICLGILDRKRSFVTACLSWVVQTAPYGTFCRRDYLSEQRKKCFLTFANDDDINIPHPSKCESNIPCLNMTSSIIVCRSSNNMQMTLI